MHSCSTSLCHHDDVNTHYLFDCVLDDLGLLIDCVLDDLVLLIGLCIG